MSPFFNLLVEIITSKNVYSKRSRGLNLKTLPKDPWLDPDGSRLPPREIDPNNPEDKDKAVRDAEAAKLRARRAELAAMLKGAKTIAPEWVSVVTVPGKAPVSGRGPTKEAAEEAAALNAMSEYVKARVAGKTAKDRLAKAMPGVTYQTATGTAGLKDHVKSVKRGEQYNHLLSKDSWIRHNTPYRNPFLNLDYRKRALRTSLRAAAGDDTQKLTVPPATGVVSKDTAPREPMPRRIEVPVRGLSVAVDGRHFQFSAGREMAMLTPKMAATMAKTMETLASGKIKPKGSFSYGPIELRYDAETSHFFFKVGHQNIQMRAAAVKTLANRILMLATARETGAKVTSRGVVTKFKALMKTSRLKENVFVALIASELQLANPGIPKLPASDRTVAKLVDHFAQHVGLEAVGDAVAMIAARHARG